MSMRFEFAGKYKFEKCKVDEFGNDIDGTRVDITDWFNNVITDAGLNLFANRFPLQTFQQCRVGSGNTAPTVSDTGLVAQVATTTTIQNTTNGTSGASPYYGYVRRTFRFAMGAAAGNLSEVAIFGGPSNTTCVSRALIVNGGGTPTTITILSDEVLDVIYEFRSYVPEVDVSFGPIDISGTDYSGTIRAARVGSAQFDNSYDTSIINSGCWGVTGVSNYGYVNGMLFDNGDYRSRKGVKVSTSQTLGALTGTIGTLSGNYLDVTPTSITTSPYSPGSFYIDHEILYDLNYGNISGIGSMYIATTLGAFQMSFTPKIDKDATKRLKLNIRVSWGRYTP